MALDPYGRLNWRGVVANRRTIEMLEITELRALGEFAPLSIPQGSYNAGGVSQSGGTHDGGGALDISVRGMTATERNRVVRELRETSFAAWYRTPAQGFVYHIHAIAIGDKEMSSTAAQQVAWYKQGLNGLWPPKQGPDDGPDVPIHVYRQDIDMSYYGPAGKNGSGGWDSDDWKELRDQIEAIRITDGVSPTTGDTISLGELLGNDRKRLYDTKVLLNDVSDKVDAIKDAVVVPPV